MNGVFFLYVLLIPSHTPIYLQEMKPKNDGVHTIIIKVNTVWAFICSPQTTSGTWLAQQNMYVLLNQLHGINVDEYQSNGEGGGGKMKTIETLHI